MAYKDLIEQAQEALAAQKRLPLKQRLTLRMIAHRAGVSVPWLHQLRTGVASNPSYKRLQAVLQACAEGREPMGPLS